MGVWQWHSWTVTCERTYQTVHLNLFLYPSYHQSCSFFLPCHRVWFHSLFPLFLVTRLLEKKKKKKRLPWQQLPLRRRPELSSWRARFLPVTETKQGDIVTLTSNGLWRNHAEWITQIILLQRPARSVYLAIIFCPWFSIDHIIAPADVQTFCSLHTQQLCLTWYKHWCVNIISSWF